MATKMVSLALLYLQIRLSSSTYKHHVRRHMQLAAKHCSGVAALTTASYFAGISKHHQSSAATAAITDVKTGTHTGESNSRCPLHTAVLPIRVFTANTALVEIGMILLAARTLFACWQGCASKIC